MDTRTHMLDEFYTGSNEETRLERSRQGQLEYFVTMDFIHRFVSKSSKLLEIGAGTGRYSIALAKEGIDVTAVELLETNLSVLKEKSKGIANIASFQGDALDLSRFADESFDVTLVFGPMYHLYDPDDVDKAINEAIRVTKKGGVLLFAFLSVFGIMASNYLDGRWAFGEKENFTDDYKVLHFEEQLFTGYDIREFEGLFEKKPVEHVTTAGVDWLIEIAAERKEFSFSDEDFEKFKKWYLAFAENRELLGSTNHLLYICRKN